MSFGKANRFNYKPVERMPSPADYSVSSRFNNGIKFPKSTRFSSSMDGENATFTVCPRMFHYGLRSSTPNSQEDCDTDAIKLLKRKIINFNRDDIRRQSIRKKSSDKNPTTQSYTYLPRNDTDSEESFWYDCGDYIDDDYYSLTSSEELDKLREIEKQNFEEVCKEIRRIKARNSVRNHQNGSNFEEIVLEKLRNIEADIGHVKGEFVKLHVREKQAIDMDITTDDYLTQTYVSLDELKRKMFGIITKTFKKLEEDVEEEKKAKLKEVQEKISRQLKEISSISEESEIKKICKNAAEQLTENISAIFENNVAIVGSQNVSMGEVTEEVAKGETLNYENICEILSSQLQESLDYNDILEQDELDITLKYNNSQHLLETQGIIIEALKDHLTDLKLNMQKKKCT